MRYHCRILVALSVASNIFFLFILYWKSEEFINTQSLSKLLFPDTGNATQTVTSTSRCGFPTLRSVNNPEKILEVISECEKFSDRVRDFGLVLDILRKNVMVEIGFSNNNNTSGNVNGLESMNNKTIVDSNCNESKSGNVTLVWGGDDDFITQLENFTQVRTIALPWFGARSNWTSMTDYSNLLLQNYYEWTAHDPLCNWIETPGLLSMKYDAIYNRTCNRQLSKTVEKQSLRPLYLNAKPIRQGYYWPNNGSSFPLQFYEQPPPYVFYLHVITDATVSDWGEVYSGKLKYIPYGCIENFDPRTLTKPDCPQFHDELYVINQYWGSAVFHRMLEIIPRLAGSLDFLKRNPRIKILCPEGPSGRLGELFKSLGLDEGRIVDTCSRARIVYLPRSSMCGMMNVQETQIISKIYRNYITENFPPSRRDKIIVIRRTVKRVFTEQDGIEKLVGLAAERYNLNMTVFTDNPAPSLNETMRMFHAAVMVVAPHGAGLSNIVFSQPGTYVIEGVCNMPYVNLCFQRASTILGHHYHGIPAVGGCELDKSVVNITASEIDRAVRLYLDLRNNTQVESHV